MCVCVLVAGGGGSCFENYHGQDECCIQILIQCYSVSSNRAFLPGLQLRLSTLTTCTARKTSEGSEDLVHSKQPRNMKQYPQTSTESVCIDSGSKQPQMLQNACRLLSTAGQFVISMLPRIEDRKPSPPPSVQPLSHGVFTVAL